MTLPGTIEELSGEWLTSALREAGRIEGDGVVTIAKAGPLGTGTAYATEMTRIELEGPEGTLPSATGSSPPPPRSARSSTASAPTPGR